MPQAATLSMKKKNSGTGVFLWNSRNTFYYKTPPDDCIWTLLSNWMLFKVRLSPSKKNVLFSSIKAF